MLYIYIYIRKINFLRSRFGEVFGEVLERFLERFWRGLGRGFREVLGEVLKRFCIPKSDTNVYVIIVLFYWLLS